MSQVQTALTLFIDTREGIPSLQALRRLKPDLCPGRASFAPTVGHY
jgi:hypothetical protein